jgi:DNA mismatch endonuclease (patch repair protein)
MFINGCFWHGHECARGRRPSSNKRFWNKKISGNQARDLRVTSELETMGWSVLILWECELKKSENVLKRLDKFLFVSDS